MKRLAVVLFNLGGPDSLAAVRPFLFNLFSDPAIIALPAILRLPLAALISVTRARSAKASYAHMGGASPLLKETIAQAEALEEALKARRPQDAVKVFVAMRYWDPATKRAARAVAAFEPDEVVLAPLYPQFSTTTTASSATAWRKRYKGPGRVRGLCCYPRLQGLIEAHARRIESAWFEAGSPAPVRLLLSAHGLPQAVIARGDPYQAQVEATAAAIAERLGMPWEARVCYQSRVGPMPWLGPDTLSEIKAAARDGLGIVIAPISFVSEHVETLVELDHDYAIAARAMGCPSYVRAPALGIESGFIDALADAVSERLGGEATWSPASGYRCAARWGRCPSRIAAAAA